MCALPAQDAASLGWCALYCSWLLWVFNWAAVLGVTLFLAGLLLQKHAPDLYAQYAAPLISASRAQAEWLLATAQGEIREGAYLRQGCALVWSGLLFLYQGLVGLWGWLEAKFAFVAEWLAPKVAQLGTWAQLGAWGEAQLDKLAPVWAALKARVVLAYTAFMATYFPGN
jgi:hypothetical protein